MTYIPYYEGKVYDTAHLRPFNLDLAKAGHPLATYQGEEIRLLRDMDSAWRFDVWRDSKWTARTAEDLNWTLRLAPLAVKDGRPLHVGDVIQSMNCRYDPFKLPEWEAVKVAVDSFRCYLEENLFIEWRFPKD